MKKIRIQKRKQRRRHRKYRLRKKLSLYMVCCLLSMFCALSSVQAERIKDIASFEGVRDNQLIGYGLVVGLDGSGDKGKTAVQSISSMLKRMGVTVNPDDIKTKSIAAVIVTATLPAFAKPGMKVGALVSTMGDAKSIQGGTLLLTPMKGPDGKVYGLAQGPVSIGGFAAEGEGASGKKNHPTAGKVPEGLTIEKEPFFSLGDGSAIRLFINTADFATVDRISHTINESFKGDYATALDPSSVRIVVPDAYKDNLIGMITRVEAMNVNVDMRAKVVINERTGTIVIGSNVTISPVAIAHGSLAILISERPEVSQPLPFAPRGAETTVVPRTNIQVEEQRSSLIPVSGVTLGEVVRALNALGVSPRDLISILQALKSSGALKAQLKII
jgi:flagellar P-ring protein precursor FlgI